MRLLLDEGVGRRSGASVCGLIGRLLFADLQAHLVGYHLLDLLGLLFDLPDVLAALLGDVAHVIGLVIGVLGFHGLGPC